MFRRWRPKISPIAHGALGRGVNLFIALALVAIGRLLYSEAHDLASAFFLIIVGVAVGIVSFRNPIGYPRLFATFLLLFVALLILHNAFLVAKIADLNEKRREDFKSLNDQIYYFQKDIDDKISRSDREEQTKREFERWAAELKSQRIELRQQDYQKYLQILEERLGTKPACKDAFRTTAPTQTVHFEDSEAGIALDLPYNPDWGNDVFSIPPYERGEVAEPQSSPPPPVIFGSVYAYTSGYNHKCEFQRGWPRLSFKPAQTAEEILADYTFLDGLARKTIAGLDTVQFLDPGYAGNYPTIVIIGKRYNYEINSGLGDEDSFAGLETIAKSAKLLY